MIIKRFLRAADSAILLLAVFSQHRPPAHLWLRAWLQPGSLIEETIAALATAHKKTATMGGHDALQPLAFSTVV
jgi:hypothetical protein